MTPAKITSQHNHTLHVYSVVISMLTQKIFTTHFSCASYHLYYLHASTIIIPIVLVFTERLSTVLSGLWGWKAKQDTIIKSLPLQNKWSESYVRKRQTGVAPGVCRACARVVGLGEEVGEGLTDLELGLEPWLALPGERERELMLGDSDKEFWAQEPEKETQ